MSTRKPNSRRFATISPTAFRNVPLNDFVNGPYSMDADLRKQWDGDRGIPALSSSRSTRARKCSTTPFKNGKTYGDCFPDKGIGIRQNYPYFDDKTGEVVTLELALNRCRQANGEQPLSYVKDDMAALTAYMAFTSRGKLFDIKIPDDPRALAAYENGKKYFYARRGQLNFSCASCHVQSPGEHIRTEVLAPALGILAAMPIYRSEWGSMGTISRRFVTCNSQVRGVPLEPQDEDYRDVEYYLSYMGNGLPISGPGARP